MIRDQDGNRLPDFLLVGAAKSGTTSLFKSLGRHPGLALPRIKEPEHLALLDSTVDLLSKSTVLSSYQSYVKLFSSLPNNALTGEASTVYLPLIDYVIERLSKLGDQTRHIKIIVIIREPVDRLYSHYLMKALRGRETLPLEITLREEIVTSRYREGYDITYDYVLYSKYGKQIDSLINFFHDVLVLKYDDLNHSFPETVNRVFSFLGVPPCSNVREVRTNVGGARRSDAVSRALHFLFYREHLAGRLSRQILSTETRAKLHNLLSPLVFLPAAPSIQLRRMLSPVFESDIQQVEHLTGLDLSDWRCV